MLVVVTVRSISSMRPSAFAADRPSESEIAAPISVDGDERRGLAWRSARRSRSAGPKPSTVPARLRKMITARHVVSVNWAMLKTTLIAGSRRSNSSTTIGPIRPATTRSIGVGEQQAEDERQVAERERVGAAAEVQVDDAALGGEEAERQPPPRDVHADDRTSGGAGPARRGATTEAATMATLSAQTPPSADSRRRAPFPGDMGALIGGASATLKRWTDVRRKSAQQDRGAAAGCRRSRRSRRTAARARRR